jgi:hypothetical protein
VNVTAQLATPVVAPGLRVHCALLGVNVPVVGFDVQLTTPVGVCGLASESVTVATQVAGCPTPDGDWHWTVVVVESTVKHGWPLGQY